MSESSKSGVITIVFIDAWNHFIVRIDGGVVVESGN